MADKVSAAIVGASGYTGAELMRLLARHPNVVVDGLYAGKAAGKSLPEVFGHLHGEAALPAKVEAFNAKEVIARCQVAFLALPHGESAAYASELLAGGVTVFDLSADFRIQDTNAMQSWYGEASPETLRSQAVYGLVERHREALRTAKLIAVPGCFPTSAILALAPFLESQQIASRGIIIDSKSGISGAGRSATQGSLYSEMGEGTRAYKVAGQHRHIPEIEEQLSFAFGTKIAVTFTPHVVPMSRGILTVAYADSDASQQALQDTLDIAYRNEKFVRVLDASQLPDTTWVRGSNLIAIAVRKDERTGKAVIISAIDNLVKGAAGQAIQCLNVNRGWAEDAGLSQLPLFP